MPGRRCFSIRIESELGRADLRFLERSFQGLMLNFNWWVNRKDPQGRNVFAGGFLGLDNIGVFDRSAPLPTGGHLDQADGTAWMAFYCLCMLEIALILTEYDQMYEEIAYRFLEHFVWITYAMDRIGANHDEMWDTEDGFFYDLLHFPNGDAMRLKIRSMVGLLPLCAAAVFEPGTFEHHPRIIELIELFRKRHPEVLQKIAIADDSLCRLRRAKDDLSLQQGKAAAHSGLYARRERISQPVWHPLSVEVSSRASLRASPRRTGIQSSVPSRRVEHWHVWRQLQLAGADMDAGKWADDSRTVGDVSVLWRRLQG